MEILLFQHRNRSLRFDKFMNTCELKVMSSNFPATTKLPVSLVVITLNEEKNIEECLRSVPWVSDLVVIDSGSTDETVSIAEACGARVIQKEWLGFGLQKKFASSQAKFDWILNLDADERMTPELSAEILGLFPNFDEDTGYLIPRKSWHLGSWIFHGGWYPDFQLRFFNRKKSDWNSAHIHEKVVAAKTEKLKSPFTHFVFRDLHHQIETNNRYSLLLAEELFRQGKRFSIFKLVLKPWTKFLETYFWKKGFMDGLPGLIIAVGAAYSVFLKWAKLWELEKK